ncbi:hypothetical protein [Trueperella pyogenes]|uniref:hypothetical protein n=1 Tax=Trueperella pyogenes TaxID=1661 RepID=UPI00345CB9A0
MNPAEELHELLTEWNSVPSGVTIKEQRAIDGDWVSPTLRALSLLGLLTDQGAFERNEETREALYTLIFTADRGVTVSTAGQNLINGSHLSVLGAIATMWHSPVYTRSGIDVVPDFTDLVTDLLDGLTELDGEARRYLLVLAQNLDKAVTEFSVFGPEKIRGLANELIGALAVYGQDAAGDQREGFARVVNEVGKFLKGLLHVGAHAAVEAGVQGVIGM